MKILWSVLPLLVVLLSTIVAGQTDSTTPITGGTDSSTLLGQTDSATPNPAGQTDSATPNTGGITDGPSDSDSYSYSYYGTSDFIRCYTCRDALSNDECNGVGEGENGTLQMCSQDIPNCKTEIQMNPEGTGWLLRKGCVDYNDCYDKMYDSLLAGENSHCLGPTWSGLAVTDPLPGNTWCYFCCSSRKKDKCNYDNYISDIAFPEDNEWDPDMQWDLSIAKDSAENLKPMFLLTVAVFIVVSFIW